MLELTLTLLIGFEFGSVNTLSFEKRKEFSAKALSYGLPRLDIDGVIPYDVVRLKYWFEVY